MTPIAEFSQWNVLLEQVSPVLMLIIFFLCLYLWNQGSVVYRMKIGITSKLSPCDELIYDMRVVRSTRFNFSKRLEVKSRVKSFTVNILSIISIFISAYLLSNASGILEIDLKRISIAIIGLSLLALWMSLDSPPSELSRRAADAHKCGREISEVYRALKFGSMNIQDAVMKYEAVISKYPENHDPLDRAKALYDDQKKYPEKAQGVTKWDAIWKYRLSCYSPAVLALIWGVAVVGIQILFPI